MAKSRTSRRRSSGGSSSSSSGSLLAGAALAGVLLVALAFALFGGDDSAASDFDLGAIEAPVIDGAPTLASNEPAPTVTAESLLTEGDATIPVEGEATIIAFLAHWCPACNEELPIIEEFLDSGTLPEGVAVTAVATGIDPTRNNYPPDQWLDRRDREWDIPTLVDPDGSIAAAYGITGYPTFVFVDANGTVVGRSGATDAATLQQVADALAAG